MTLGARIQEILRRNLARARQKGQHRAWIQLGDVQNEEWGKDLPVEEIQIYIEAALALPEWYRLSKQPSAKHGIAGWEYTDAEGAGRTKEYSR